MKNKKKWCYCIVDIERENGKPFKTGTQLLLDKPKDYSKDVYALSYWNEKFLIKKELVRFINED